MDQKISLGLGRIHAEAGEIRAFLLDFVSKMSHAFDQVVLEEGYGEAMGIDPEAYNKHSNVHFGSVKDVYRQDLVLVLRYPSQELIEMMPTGSCLISMCHFHTRPKRREHLKTRGLNAVSLDAITDDNGQRLVENLNAVAWNGCETAFKVLQDIWPESGLENQLRYPVNVTIMGSGGVGSLAVPAAIRYGDREIWVKYAEQKIPGNIVRVIDYDLTSHQEQVRALLESTHLLVDATQRSNPSQIIIPNGLLGLMPKHAVILDLSVDPYDFYVQPNEVKGIEGIPQGDLNQYVFSPDDPAWEQLPDQVSTIHRRWVASCYSWPGIHPRACMLRYGNQLSPLLRRLARAGGIEGINPSGRYHDRALARGILRFWPE
ncbi:MAG: alanine dehydrogenase [Brevefilum sp.]